MCRPKPDYVREKQEPRKRQQHHREGLAEQDGPKELDLIEGVDEVDADCENKEPEEGRQCAEEGPGDSPTPIRSIPEVPDSLELGPNEKGERSGPRGSLVHISVCSIVFLEPAIGLRRLQTVPHYAHSYEWCREPPTSRACFALPHPKSS